MKKEVTVNIHIYSDNGFDYNEYNIPCYINNESYDYIINAIKKYKEIKKSLDETISYESNNKEFTNYWIGIRNNSLFKKLYTEVYRYSLQIMLSNKFTYDEIDKTHIEFYITDYFIFNH